MKKFNSDGATRASPIFDANANLIRFLPQDRRQIPLVVKYETSRIWKEIEKLYGLGPTGAAITMALLDASYISDGMVSYSRRSQYYSERNSHRLLSYRLVIREVGVLDDRGLITHHKQCPGGRGWQSAMSGKAQFLETVVYLREGLRLEIPRHPVILRDADGRPLNVPKTREVRRMEHKVSAVNEAITSTDIRTDNGVPAAATVNRIFNENFKRGGRVYGIGASWQNLSSKERQRILIDGEPVVEIDYSALHPALLYSEVGVRPPDDCYSIGNWPRSLVKLGLLVLINASNVHQVRLYLAHHKAMAMLGPVDEQNALAMASCLIEDIKVYHFPIAKFFHTDAGARLMRVDSDLAMAVLSRLMRQGIVALPVHDSFLVQARHAEALKTAMVYCAAEIGLVLCKVRAIS